MTPADITLGPTQDNLMACSQQHVLHYLKTVLVAINTRTTISNLTLNNKNQLEI